MKNIFLIFIIFTAFTFAQQKSDANLFTGNLSVDAKTILDNYKEHLTPQMTIINSNKKSPLLAGIFSLLIPGAGELYTGEYLKAGIFVALEAAVVGTAIVYDNKGNKKTNEFQDYADAYKNPEHNWSVVRYAEWLVLYEGADRNKIIISEDPNIPPWERVNWKELNSAETGSHHLPPHGEQQYYELIGKYHQYSSGWNDFIGGGNKEIISPNYHFYSQMRGDANSFYSVASTAVIGIYVNHFLSVLDAVWSSIQYNKDITVNVRLENIQVTEYRSEFYPVMHITYNF
jgi:hypothetical protein